MSLVKRSVAARMLRKSVGAGAECLRAVLAKLEHSSGKKWSPVFRQKMRALDKTRMFSGSLDPENTLEMAPRCREMCA
jgi:hypothetical protein